METNSNPNITTRSSRKMMRAVIGAVILIVIILAGLAIAYKLKQKVGSKLEASGEYQAVFLSTGQVYFGKLEMEHSSIVLTDVYYLQVNGTGTSTTPQPATGSTSDPDVKLVKLGSELHGPQDKMYITKSNVLFWENLKTESKVIQAIHSYQSK